MWRVVASFVLLAGFGCDMPRDVEGTYERVRGGEMRVGVSELPPWTISDGGEFSGIEIELLKGFAEQLGTKLEVSKGAESELFHRLRQGELDIVVGGIVQRTPWSHKVGLTRPYLKAPHAVTGETVKHVAAVRAGENRWLLEVDRFLQSHRDQAERLFQESRR